MPESRIVHSLEFPAQKGALEAWDSYGDSARVKDVDGKRALELKGTGQVWVDVPCGLQGMDFNQVVVSIDPTVAVGISLRVYADDDLVASTQAQRVTRNDGRTALLFDLPALRRVDAEVSHVRVTAEQVGKALPGPRQLPALRPARVWTSSSGPGRAGPPT